MISTFADCACMASCCSHGHGLRVDALRSAAVARVLQELDVCELAAPGSSPRPAPGPTARPPEVRQRCRPSGRLPRPRPGRLPGWVRPSGQQLARAARSSLPVRRLAPPVQAVGAAGAEDATSPGVAGLERQQTPEVHACRRLAPESATGGVSTGAPVLPPCSSAYAPKLVTRNADSRSFLLARTNAFCVFRFFISLYASFCIFCCFVSRVYQGHVKI